MRRIFTIFVLMSMLGALPAQAASEQPKLSYTSMKVQIVRVQIKADVSFDDAAESLKLRANQHNMKFVGSSLLYKQIEALTGKPAKRMEIFSFCDALTAQQMIEVNPLTISFMPCRVALLEDDQGKRWIISMFMDEGMISRLPASTRKNAERVLGFLKDMMLAASNGDL